jgi:molecular chaperone GrpE
MLILISILSSPLLSSPLLQFESLTKKFDPNFHDCLFQVPDPTKEPGTVAQVLKDGFTLNGRVLRPASVGVVSKPSS